MREDGIELESEREVFLWLTRKNITRRGDWGHGWDVLMLHRVFHQFAKAVKDQLILPLMRWYRDRYVVEDEIP